MQFKLGPSAGGPFWLCTGSVSLSFSTSDVWIRASRIRIRVPEKLAPNILDPDRCWALRILTVAKQAWQLPDLDDWQPNLQHYRNNEPQYFVYRYANPNFPPPAASTGDAWLTCTNAMLPHQWSDITTLVWCCTPLFAAKPQSPPPFSMHTSRGPLKTGSTVELFRFFLYHFDWNHTFCCFASHKL